MRQITFYNMLPAGPTLSSFSTPLTFALLPIVTPRICPKPIVAHVPRSSCISHLPVTLPINSSKLCHSLRRGFNLRGRIRNSFYFWSILNLPTTFSPILSILKNQSLLYATTKLRWVSQIDQPDSVARNQLTCAFTGFEIVPLKVNSAYSGILDPLTLLTTPRPTLPPTSSSCANIMSHQIPYCNTSSLKFEGVFAAHRPGPAVSLRPVLRP
jgi:hypothetical protein